MQKLRQRKPEKILLQDDLYILWRDGRESHYKFHDLRCACPCASCVSELTGERVLKPESVPKHVHASGSEYVGNYALRIHWSDGHNTGLYNFKHLRALDEARTSQSEA